MRAMRAAAIVLTVAVVTAGASLARAQDEARAEAAPGEQLDEDDAAARDRFRLGTRHFDAGDYGLAAAEFQAAYDLSHRPALLYNVYLAYERLGDLERAIPALEGYLRDGEPGDRREALESRLERMRQRLADEERQAREREERERRLLEAAGPGATPWIVAGSGALVAGAGVVLLLVSASDISAVEDPGPMPVWADVEDAYDRAPVLSTVGGIALGVGAAALLTGLTWGLLSIDAGGTEAEVAVGPGGLALRGRL